MTTEVNNTIERYVISGAGPYPYSWRIFDEDELVITALEDGEVDPVTLVANTNYTVAGVNDEDGGSITLIGGAETTYDGFTLDIRSLTPIEQPTSIKNQGTFAPVVHEKAFDRLSRQLQDVYRQLKQAWRYPDNVNLDAKMSSRSAWLGKWPYVNEDGEIEPSVLSGTAITESVLTSIGMLSTGIKYDITPAEAGLTIVNYYKIWGDIQRYGGDPTQVADSATAIAAAIAQFAAGGSAVYVSGLFKSNTAIAIPDAAVGLRMYGDGYINSEIRFPNATTGFTYSPASYTEAGFHWSDFRIRGIDGATLDLITLNNGTNARLVNMGLRSTAGSLVKLGKGTGSIGFLGFSIEDSIVESFASYAIECTDLASLLSLRNIQVNANSVTGVGVLGFTGTGAAGQVTLQQINANGNNLLANVIKVANGNLSQVAIRECYAEFMTGGIVKAAGTGIIADMEVVNGNFATSASSDFDLSGAVVHKNITIRDVSTQRTTGFLFEPGATTEYTLDKITLGGGTAAIMSGWGTARTSAIKRAGGTVHPQGVDIATTLTLVGCTTSPTISITPTISEGVATIHISAVTATSNSNACKLTGLSGLVTPSVDRVVTCRYTDNGVDALGLATINTSGELVLSNQAGSTTFFTGSGTKGFGACDLTFPL